MVEMLYIVHVVLVGMTQKQSNHAFQVQALWSKVLQQVCTAMFGMTHKRILPVSELQALSRICCQVKPYPVHRRKPRLKGLKTPPQACLPGLIGSRLCPQ